MVKLGPNRPLHDAPLAPKGEKSPSEILRRCVGLLVQGLIIHSPRLEDAAKAEFGQEMTRHLGRMQHAENIDQLLPILGAVIDSYATYGKKVERHAESVQRELSSMLILLCEELLQRGLPPAIEECLGKLGGEVSSAKNLQDFIQTRKNLQQAFQWHISDQDVPAAHVPVPINLDTWESPTGFPGPAKAREYLSKFLLDDRSIYVLMFKLAAFHAVEQRYGADAAQDYLNATAQYMVQALKREDRLFHWSRDILLAVVDRRVPDSTVRTEITRLVSAQREQVIEVNGRKVMIANPITFDVRNLSRYKTPTELLAAFDPFINENL